MTISSIGTVSGGIVSTLLTAGTLGAQPGGPGTKAAARVPLPGDGAAKGPEPSAAALESIAGDWQRKLADVAPELRFSVDRSSGRSLIRVVDRTTDELIRQIPSEEVLAIGQAIDAFQNRLMQDQEA